MCRVYGLESQPINDNDGWQDFFIANFSGSVDLTDEELQNSKAHSQLFHNNQDAQLYP